MFSIFHRFPSHGMSCIMVGPIGVIKKRPSNGGVHTGKASKEYKKVRINNSISPLYLKFFISSQVQGFRKYIRYIQFYL